MSSRKCEMKTKLLPRSLRRRSTAKSRSTSGGDSAEVGSSRMMMRAPEKSTRASSISCCSPIESEPMRSRGFDVDAEAGEMLARLAHHALPVDDAALGRLRAEEDVLGDRKVGDDRKLLMHHADAGIQRVAGGAEAHLLAVELHRAGEIGMHAGDDLHQRRLAGAVLADEAVDLAGAEREVDAREAPRRRRRISRCRSVREAGARRGVTSAAPIRSRCATDSVSVILWLSCTRVDGNRRRHSLERKPAAERIVRSGSGLPSTACRRRSPW